MADFLQGGRMERLEGGGGMGGDARPAEVDAKPGPDDRHSLAILSSKNLRKDEASVEKEEEAGRTVGMLRERRELMAAQS